MTSNTFLGDIDFIDKVANYGRNDSTLSTFMHGSSNN